MDNKDIEAEKQKRREFQSILYLLARHQFKPENLNDEKEIANICEKLEVLYHPNDSTKLYRHFYTDIFNAFVKIKTQEPGAAETVCLNLECIRQKYQPLNRDSNDEPIDISESLKKLYDHASLEMARINYANREYGMTIHEKELCDFRDTMNHYNFDLQKMKDSIRNTQKNYIAILSIFSAVVMVFFSGIGFSSSVLANIHQASIYRIWIGITLLGTVLFNSLWILFNFLREIIDKRQERWKLFVVANSLLAVSLILAFLFAYYGWFEAI